jgi:hypothetical protein
MDNRNVIEFNTIERGKESIASQAEMLDFNYSTDGWLTEVEEGNRNILRVNATSYVVYEGLNLFTLLSDPNYSGVSFELDFKGRNTTNSNKQLVSFLTSAGQGISINEQGITVTLAGSKYGVEYKAGERTRISVSIEKDIDDYRKVMIYVNGVLSFVSTYTSTAFAGYKTPLYINPTSGFIDIYGLRLYGSALTAAQVLNNYIASYNTSADRIAARDWNDIYAEDGVTVSFDKVKKMMPTFVFKTNEVNEIQELPPAKGEKRFGDVKYIDPVYGMSFEEGYVAKKEKPVADVQGTSSQKYPRKNFKIKTNGKYGINKGIAKEKVFTFKKDFMDSSHANNTGLAKLVQTLYSTPVPPQISYVVCKSKDGDFDAYSINGRKIDFQYIYDYAKEIGEPFASLSTVAIEPALLIEGSTYMFAFTKVGGNKQFTMCEIDAKGKEISNVVVEDRSYIRTTVYGQPCAFFWEDKDGAISYQGIYNFNTDKVSTNNMALEEEGALSFEFANNVTDGALFKSCENFTSVRNSFEYRAYEKDGISLGLWEDYYDDDLTKWANGGYDEEEEETIPVLNALYGSNETEEKQLYTKVNEDLVAINYPFLTNMAENTPFFGKEPETLEAEYRLENGNIEASFVAASATSDSIKFTDTIKALGGDAYYEAHTELTPVPSVGIANPINCQIINQDVNYILQ